MLEVGTVIGGRLRVDSLLGAGGMGIVAAATHLELGHKVAVKVLREEMAQNPVIVERFIREARAVVNLRTEHVCRVFDVGRLDSGAPYIVMELLAGADLAHAIAQRPLPVATAVDYVMQACVAIAEAHASGIVHRDIKPANLFVTRRLDGGPLVKVLDFGIAKAADHAGPHLTHTTGMMGSPGYMSPEQLLSARNVDARTDIWALGITLYQLVSGRMPFAAPTITEIAIKVASDPPPPLDVDPGLQAVIFRCLEKRAEDRYPTIAALVTDLARFASSDGRRIATLASTIGGGPPTAPAPPVVPITAPTAASLAAPAPAPHTDLPATMEPPRAPVTGSPARSRVLLVVGALLLVGATVAVMLVINGDKSTPASASAPAPAPGAAAPSALPGVTPEPAPPSTVTHVPAPTTPPDASAPADARAAVIGVRKDARDPWKTTNEPALTEPEDEPEDDSNGDKDMVFDPSTMGSVYTPQHLEQMRTQCKKLGKAGTIPLAGPGAIMCYCALGQVARAQSIVDATSDVAMRNGLRMACAQLGVKLK